MKESNVFANIGKLNTFLGETKAWIEDSVMINGKIKFFEQAVLHFPTENKGRFNLRAKAR